MGVCTEERPVMHWQQSARFLGPSAKERSISPPIVEQHRSSFCGTIESVIGNRLSYTSSCPDNCNHSTKSFSITYKEKYNSYDIAESSIFDESSKKNSIGKNQMDCPEVSDETNSGISFKTEPFGPPSSPESTTEIKLSRNPENCAGCGRFIQDRFYLSAVEKRWHVTCLQCHACRLPLDRESSCYSRDGNIYCKSDYYSFYGARRCSRCLASISSSELVMRARNLVFHVNCFCCAACQTPLTKGDQFGIIDGVIYCRSHYILAREGDPISSKLSEAFSYSDQYGPTQNDSPTSQQDSHRIMPSSIFIPSTHVITGAPRQKGRPRKRKPKDIEVLTANMDLNSEYLDFNRGSHISGSSRTKRMRTSFKHHQLRTMKSYFAINHNPDAKDLKQLSQKTGLPKRVLQVWFQNARAKWRRMMMKQDNSNAHDKNDGNLDLDNISTHSPSSFLMRNNNSSPHSLD